MLAGMGKERFVIKINNRRSTRYHLSPSLRCLLGRRLSVDDSGDDGAGRGCFHDS